MKKFGVFLLGTLLFCMLLSSCTEQKEATDKSQSADSTAQLQTRDLPSQSELSTASSSDTSSASFPPEPSVEDNTLQRSDSTAQSQIRELKPQAELPTTAPSDAPPVSSPSEKSADDDTLIISEKMFLTQINDIYFNFDQYKEKTIVVEGMYKLLFNQEGVQDTPAVYRLGPGCCGNDGWGGFLLKYDGDYPEDNAWIKVTGTPELVENGYFQDLYLNVSNIEVLEERGAEFVSQ